MSDTMSAIPLELDSHSLVAFANEFEEWVERNSEGLAALWTSERTLDDRVEGARKVQALLFAEGWARCGWPIEVGGLGGSVLHRAVAYDVLSRRGPMVTTMFEHIEVLAPTLRRFAPPSYSAEVIPELLSGEHGWCQAFSEPDAGSDLASLRTVARAVGNDYEVSGTKVWTSWAKFASRCLLLARTGSAESRHRGLTMFAVDLRQPGITVRPLPQANGHDELCEVTFDNVHVPRGRVIGEPGGGWSVALDVLRNERGTFAWFRACLLYSRLEASRLSELCEPVALGEVLVDLASARASAIDALLHEDDDGRAALERATFTKLLLATAEQNLHDRIFAVCGRELAFASAGSDSHRELEDYQFSRVVSLYGGSRQMQLNAIASRVLGL